MTTSNIPSRHRSDNGQPTLRRRVSEQTAPEITIRYGDHRIELTAADLAMPDCIEQHAQQWQEYSGSFRFEFCDLLSLSDDVRYRLFAVIHEFKGRYQIEMQVDGHAISVSSLFDAALAIIVPTDDVARLERARRAALEAIATEHPDAIMIAVSRLAARLKEAGVIGVLPQRLEKDVKTLLGGTSSVEHLTAEAAARLVMQLILVPNAEDRYQDSENDTSEVEHVAVRYFENEFYKYVGLRWKVWPENELRAIVAKLLQESGYGGQVTTRFVADVLTNMKGMALLGSAGAPLPLWIDGDDEPTASPYLAFSNGMIRLDDAIADTPLLYQHDIRHFSITVLPYDFDSDATCPLWEETLREIFAVLRYDDDRTDNRVLLLQEFIGYLLLFNNLQFEKFLILVGEGANGKSTIIKVIVWLLGKDNVSHVPIDRIGDNFRLYGMANKLANMVADMNRLDRIEEGLLKNLVSGEPTQADIKHKDPRTLYPTAKLIFSTNQLPQISDRSNGLIRRMIVIPFLQHFTEGLCDLDRAERLKDELPGIYNWALAGARRLLQQGHFSHCDVCAQALEEHRIHSDPIAQFVDQCILQTADPNNKSRTAQIIEAYKLWCEANSRKAVNSAEFGKQLIKNTGAVKERLGSGTREYIYTGIRLSPAGLMLFGTKRPRSS